MDVTWDGYFYDGNQGWQRTVFTEHEHVSNTPNRRSDFPNKCLGTRYLVPGTRYLAPGTRYLVPGTWYLVPGTQYLVPGTWSQATGE